MKISPRFYFLQASFDDLENVPYWYGNTRRLQKMFEDSIRYKLKGGLSDHLHISRFSEVEEYSFSPNIRSRLYPEVASLFTSIK